MRVIKYMNSNLDVDDSGMNKILSFLEKTDRGTILTIDDFKSINGLSYTNIRTILVCLCSRNVLIRICRGVYCYPKYENGKAVFPLTYDILTQIAQKDGYKLCPTGEFAKYLLGIRKTMPSKIICYNNYKIKTINMENGVCVKIIPSKRFFHQIVKSDELRLLYTYIRSNGIENIDIPDKIKLKEFFYKNNLDSKKIDQSLSLEVMNLLDM